MESPIFPDLPLQVRVCSKVFEKHEVTVNCYDCSIDSSSIYCLECFDFARHQGHRFQIYETSGCCDCGDDQALLPESFCSRHSGKEVDVHIPPQLRQQFGESWSKFIGRLLDSPDGAEGVATFQKLIAKCSQSIAYCNLISRVIQEHGFLERMMDRSIHFPLWKAVCYTFCITMFQDVRFREHCLEVYARGYDRYVDCLGQLAIQLFSRHDSVRQLFTKTKVYLNLKLVNWEDKKVSQLVTTLIVINRNSVSTTAFWQCCPETYYSLYILPPAGKRALVIQNYVLNRVLFKGLSCVKEDRQLLLHLATSHLKLFSQAELNFLAYRTYFLLLLTLDRCFPQLLTNQLLVAGVVLVKKLQEFLLLIEKANSKERAHPDLLDLKEAYNNSVSNHIDRAFLLLLFRSAPGFNLELEPKSKKTEVLSLFRTHLLNRVSLALDGISEYFIDFWLSLPVRPAVASAVKRCLSTYLSIVGKQKFKGFLAMFNVTTKIEEEELGEQLLLLLNEIADCKDGAFFLREPIPAPDPFWCAYSVRLFNQLECQVKDKHFIFYPPSAPLTCPNALKIPDILFKCAERVAKANEQDPELRNILSKFCEVAVKVACLSRNQTTFQTLSHLVQTLIGRGLLKADWEEKLQLMKKSIFEEKWLDRRLAAEQKPQLSSEEKKDMKLRAQDKKRKLRLKMQEQRDTTIVEVEARQQIERLECLVCREQLNEGKKFGLPALVRLNNIHSLLEWKADRAVHQKYDIAGLDNLPPGIDLWSCRHQLHVECFFQMRKNNNNKCPLCRSQANFIFPADIGPEHAVVVLDQVVSRIAASTISKEIPPVEVLALQTIALAAKYYELDSESFVKDRMELYAIFFKVCKQFFALFKDQSKRLAEMKVSSKKEQIVSYLLGQQIKVEPCASVQAVTGVGKANLPDHSPLLIRLPSTFKQFHIMFSAAKCQLCDKHVSPSSLQLSKCLLCGLVLCNMTCLGKKQPVGNLNRHASKYHAGNSVFIGLSSLKQYFVCLPHNCKEDETLYVDQYGGSYGGNIRFRDRFKLNYARFQGLQAMARRNSFNEVVLAKERKGTAYIQFVY